eukprot:11785632-Ditylum_brightwellii.AAC.1
MVAVVSAVFVAAATVSLALAKHPFAVAVDCSRNIWEDDSSNNDSDGDNDETKESTNPGILTTTKAKTTTQGTLKDVNLSPVSEGSNPDVENQDNGQSTMYSSAKPLAIEQ